MQLVEGLAAAAQASLAAPWNGPRSRPLAVAGLARGLDRASGARGQLPLTPAQRERQVVAPAGVGRQARQGVLQAGCKGAPS